MIFELRKEVSSWINANWDASLDLITWRKNLLTGLGSTRLAEGRFWNGLSPEESSVIEEEFSKKGVIGAAQSGVRLLAAVTILEHGTREQKDRYLKPILTGEEVVSALVNLEADLIWQEQQPEQI